MTSNIGNTLRERLRTTFSDTLIASEYFDETYSKQGFERFPFDRKCSYVTFSKGFGNDCQLLLSKTVLHKLKYRTAKLQIVRMGQLSEVSDLFITIGDFTGSISILVGSSGTVFVGNCGQLNLDLRVGHDSKVIVGDKTTVMGARIVAINSLIAIKTDAMLSDEILIQGFEQHGIVDLKSGKIINQNRKETIIGKHVWVGRRATLMPGVSIGDGSIIGACSVVTTDVSKCSISTGVPSRTVREDVSWSRLWTHVDFESQKFFDSL